jgi:hypothetical protein
MVDPRLAGRAGRPARICARLFRFGKGGRPYFQTSRLQGIAGLSNIFDILNNIADGELIECRSHWKASLPYPLARDSNTGRSSRQGYAARRHIAGGGDGRDIRTGPDAPGESVAAGASTQITSDLTSGADFEYQTKSYSDVLNAALIETPSWVSSMLAPTSRRQALKDDNFGPQSFGQSNPVKWNLFEIGDEAGLV